MIIIFFRGGFGNQIFQAQFVKSISQQNEIKIAKKSKYFEFFEHTSDWRLIKNSFFAGIVNKVAFFLAKIKIITLIMPEYIDYKLEKIETNDIKITTGLIPFVKYVSGYFQTDLHSLDLPTPRHSFTLASKRYMNFKFKEKNTVFIHVRLGDYKDFRFFGEKVVLPNEYYHNCIKWFKQNTLNPIFLFFSDEIESVKKEFNHIDNSFFISDSELSDFSLMLSCKGGIISNSTFSWWAAYLLPSKSIVIAPKYWLGWRKKIWYPPAIRTNKFKYLS